jgi:hypothetical protein
MPHSTYSKKKSFHLLQGKMNLFEELKRSKMEKNACSTTGKPTHLFRTKCVSLDSV